MFQRTPPWVVPHRDRPITDFERRLYRRFPALQRAVPPAVYLSREMLVPGFVRNPKLMRLPQRVARRHLERDVADPDLRAQADARLLVRLQARCCRRTSGIRRSPSRTSTSSPSGIAEVVPNGIVTADGELHEVDTIVFATGFHVTDVRFAKIIRGRDGATMSDMWKGSPQAYRGTAVTGFPNLFIITGPNTGLGHNSLVYMIEAQLDYLMDAVRVMDQRGATRVEVRRDGPGGLQRRPPAPHGPHRVELGRLLELVHRRERQEHHDLARLHVALPAPDAPLRRGRLRAHRAGHACTQPLRRPHPPRARAAPPGAHRSSRRSLRGASVHQTQGTSLGPVLCAERSHRAIQGAGGAR